MIQIILRILASDSCILLQMYTMYMSTINLRTFDEVYRLLKDRRDNIYMLVVIYLKLLAGTKIAWANECAQKMFIDMIYL